MFLSININVKYCKKNCGDRSKFLFAVTKQSKYWKVSIICERIIEYLFLFNNIKKINAGGFCHLIKIKSVSNTRNLSIFGSVLCRKEVVCDTENYRSFTSLFVTGEMVLFASDVQRAPVIVVTPTVASQLFNFAEQLLSVQVSNNIITRAHNKLIQTLSWKLWNGGGGGGERLKPRTGQVTITSQD